MSQLEYGTNLIEMRVSEIEQTVAQVEKKACGMEWNQALVEKNEKGGLAVVKETAGQGVTLVEMYHLEKSAGLIEKTFE